MKLLCVAFLVALVFGQNGPGRGPWVIEPPEAHGLSSVLLDYAAKRVEIENEERYCMVVAKDGVIVSEHYF